MSNFTCLTAAEETGIDLADICGERVGGPGETRGELFVAIPLVEAEKTGIAGIAVILPDRDWFTSAPVVKGWLRLTGVTLY